MDNKECDSVMSELRADAKRYIELHIRMLKEARISAEPKSINFKWARCIGIISMARELDLITIKEYLNYLEDIEN